MLNYRNEKRVSGGSDKDFRFPFPVSVSEPRRDSFSDTI